MGTLSYLALVWDSADEAKQQLVDRLAHCVRSRSCHFAEAFAGNGLRVYCDKRAFDSGKIQLLPDDIGLVAGYIFRRDSKDSASRFLPRDANLVLQSEGRHLIDSFWGGYVAFLLNRSSDAVHVLRDPTGQLPCLTAEYEGIDLYFSSAEDVARTGLIAASFNWRHVAAQLMVGTIETRETGLNEIAKVLGGECVSRRRGRKSRVFYWHPFEIAKSGVIEDANLAVEAVRETVRDCVTSWASKYDKLILRLSGGLDSSIVLSCLRCAPTKPDVTCLTYYSEGSDSDERYFARIAASAAECALIEQRRQTLVPLQSILDAPRLAELRYFAPLEAERSAFESDLSQDIGAGAFFDGHGGDGIFYQSPLELAPADYLRDHGMDRRLFGIALSIARARELSVWRVLSNALKRARTTSASPLADAFQYMQLVSKEVMAGVSRDLPFVHPWLQNPAPIPPGKLAHITYMSLPPNLDIPEAGSNDPDQVTPIVSQPLFETLLRVPTYVLTQGGVDRAIARRAFAGHVPQEILERHTKGGVEDHVKDLIARNLPFIRSLLLDGVLVSEGLLDREKVAEAVSGKPSACPVTSVELITHVSAEAWCQTWRTREHRAAA